jgi:predicted transcriptional regulator
MVALGDLLFELSNDERLSILLKIRGEPMRLTHLSKELGLTVQAVSRHLSRLDEVGLTRKDANGKFSLTPYGELVIRQLQEWEFMSRHRTYFTTHSSANLPQVFVKQIGNLTSAQHLDSVMDFLRYIETTIQEAEEFVWFQVDQYPVNALAFIHKALDRGVRFRCIEPRELVSGPIVSTFTPEEERGLKRARSTPLVENRTLESIDVFLFQSEKRCTLAFPTPEGGFDYRGFTADDNPSLEWCGDLFRHYWEAAEPKVYVSPTEYVRPSRTQLPKEEIHRSIVVEGKNDSGIDAQAVQDAVDNYDEVTLRGTFNFGPSMVKISRSVVVRGDGREGDIPSTTIYKKGWAFPSREWDSVFKVDGEDTDVTIENIQFTGMYLGQARQ